MIIFVTVASSASATSVQVARTGQTTCSDTTGVTISCGGTGQDGALQVGVAWPAPRFASYSSGVQNVNDRLTGLMWAKDGNSAGSTKTWQQALDYIKTLNSNNYQGHSDWRLPNINELASLVYRQEANTSALLNTLGFYNVPANSLTNAEYWSSTTYEYSADSAYGVDMAVGFVNKQLKSSLFYVWPVRTAQPGFVTLPATGRNLCYDTTGVTRSCGGTGEDGELQTGAAWPATRFTDNSTTTPTDMTIRDGLTGLVWGKDANLPPGKTTWQAALDYIKTLNSGNYLGHSDWRLPNGNELATLINRQQADSTVWLGSNGFLNVQPNHYWTSDTYASGTSTAWFVNMKLGFAGHVDKALSDGYVLPVRGGLYSVSAHVAAGYFHSVLLKGDGTVWSWGQNSYGQLGNGNTTNSSVAIQVSGVSGVTAIGAGYYHTVALKNDGTVWSWGYNNYGQLGNGTTVNSSLPVQVSGLTDIKAISVGYYHNFALKNDGTVWAWGFNTSGQLGDGSQTNRYLPVQITSLSSISALSAANTHTVALKTDGTVWAWGANSMGQLGDGTTTIKLLPVQVTSLSGITAVSAGGSHTVALDATGSVWTWGNNGDYQLGDTSTGRTTPGQVSGVSGITAIMAGYFHTAVIGANGTVWCWGNDTFGQFGDSSTMAATSPRQVSGLPGIAELDSIYFHTVALTTDGTVLTWGRNTYGELGNGTTSVRNVPVQLSGIADVKSAVAGVYHTVALKNNGTVWAWGRNNAGQVGDGTVNTRPSPVQVGGLTDVKMVAAGSGHSVALKNDGTVWTWGQNNYGQLGTGEAISTFALVPAQVTSLTGVKSIFSSYYCNFAIKNDGTIWAWGYNLYGQLGDGTTVDKTTPVQISGLPNISTFVGGSYHTAALTTTGDVWVWGRSNTGQLGNGTIGSTLRTTPAQLTSLSGITALGAGSSHTVAIKNDGTVWLWGSNSSGQLGNGSTLTAATPVQVSGQSGSTTLAAGTNYTVVLGNGGVWAWGDNTYGQLGVGNTSNSLTPAWLGNVTGVVELLAGTYHTAAVKSDGTIWVWGDNTYGQLGIDASLLQVTAVNTNPSLDTSAPSVPTGVTASAVNTTQVNVAWSTSSDDVGVTYYQVYRNGLVAGQPAGAFNTMWQDTAVSANNTYSYTVAACDAANNCSQQSQPALVTIANPLPAGTIFTVAGGWVGDGQPGTSASLKAARGIAIDSYGNQYIADTSNNRIRKVAAGSGVITTVAGNGMAGYGGDDGLATSATFLNPYGVAVDSSGNLFIADTGNQRVRKVTAATGIISTIAGSGISGATGDGGAAVSATLSNPYGVAVDKTGNVYIADYSNSRIRKVDSTGTITTFAGNGTATFAGDGGAASASSLKTPYGVAVDSTGNVYIADYGNHRIRRVDATGIISTVAGNGTGAYAGDGGAAISANLYFPNGVALDTIGNLYISDMDNDRIRKVDVSNSTISTVAGNGTTMYNGDNIGAQLAALRPGGVAVDGSGNVFVADYSNSRIRRIDAGTGIITTTAGGTTFAGDGGLATAAGLSGPYGVAVDAAGNIYIADKNNHRIRKVTTGSGIVSTVAGNGTAAYSGDGGLATGASLNSPSSVAVDGSGNLYVADSTNHRIRKIAAGSGIISTVAGIGTAGYAGDGGAPAAASLNNPTGIAIDSFGRMYIADRSNQRVRRISSIFSNYSTTITTVAGIGTAGFGGDGGYATSANLSSPNGVTVDSAGNLYIADYSNNRIRKVSVDGTITTVAGSSVSGYTGDGGSATAASLRYPTGVAVDSSGNLYIADYSLSHIRKVTATSGIISTVAGNGIVGFAGDGGLGVAASISTPYGVALDGAGNLYIADYGNNRIRKIISPAAVVPATGSISGKVVNYSGVGISGATIKVYLKSAMTLAGSASTDASGNYTVTGLSDGSYVIDSYALPVYAEQMYGNVIGTDQASVVTVSGANVVSGINIILPIASSISGKVTNSAGVGIAGITAWVHFSNQINSWGMTTDSSGTYTIGSLPPDNYTVEFVDSSSVYVNQWYNNKAVVSVTAGSAITGINATLATPAPVGGSISGKVFAPNGTGVSGISVNVYNGITNTIVTGIVTGTDGSYFISGLADGTYKIYFYTFNTGYVPQWYNNKIGTAITSVDSVSVTSSVGISGINATLTQGGNVSGKVTDSNGIGIGGITVQVYDAVSYASFISGSTATDGTYTVYGIPGNCKIRFMSGATSYISQWYNNNVGNSVTTADVIPVTPGTTTTSINAQLIGGGTIAGTVTDSSGVALSNISVVAFNAATNRSVMSTTTSTIGSYSLNALPVGNYTIRFNSTTGANNYVSLWNSNRPNNSTADVLIVTVGSTLTVNASLPVGGTISGQLTDGTNGVSGITVNVFNAFDENITSATTDATGSYTVKGLLDGNYRLRFQEPANSSTYSAVGYVYQVYTNPGINTGYLSQGTLIPVTAAAAVTGINAVLVKGVGSISGTVTSTTGAVLSGVTVRATDLNGGLFGSASSKTDGTYTIKGLPGGTYKVEFYRTSLYAQQWYAATGDFTTATAVTVTASNDTPSINAILGSGPGIQLPSVVKGYGTVTVGSAATKTLSVYNYGTTDLVVGSLTTTGSPFALTNDRCSGVTLPGLGYCTVQVTFTPTVAGDISGSVTIPSNDPDSSLVGVLVKGTGYTPVTVGNISGTIGFSGAAVGVKITAYNSGTGVEVGSAYNDIGTGAYTITGLQAGNYKVFFAPAEQTDVSYAMQWYNGRTGNDKVNADQVTVTAGNTTYGINGNLITGGKISGVVTTTSGTPVSGVSVIVYDAVTNLSIKSISTDANGAYLISTLPVGNYKIFFSPITASGYISQYYNGKTSATADVVAVTSGNTTSGINGQLVQGGSISGAVTNSNALGISGVTVRAYNAATNMSYSSVKTATTGSYTFYGLPAGDYKILFASGSLGYISQYYNNKSGSDITTADVITVTAGSVASGINGVLTQGGNITGTVTNQSGVAVSGITVSVFDALTTVKVATATTSPSGFYSIYGIPAGNYKVLFTPPIGSTYVAQYYNNRSGSDITTADAVTVLAGSTATSVSTVMSTLPVGTITTVAGGWVGDGLIASAANLRSARGIAIDSYGNQYIADTTNHRIRKVAAGSGIISTVAGTGVAGFSGDGGSATSATLYSPYAVAVDGAGSLYIADASNQRIRKVTAAGIITTIAGTGTIGATGDGAAAVSATLSSPYGVAVDGTGNVYIADFNNSRIRKVDTTGIISTFAGNGTAGFAGDGAAATLSTINKPYGVTVDGSGILYIADYGNHRIRKVDTTGTITTVAGNGTGAYTGDGGTPLLASLYYPTAVALDAAGNLYVSDMDNNRIRKVDAGNSTISTIAGNGSTMYNGDGVTATSAALRPGGVAVDNSGNVFVADYSNSRIRRIDGVTGVISTTVGGVTFAGDGGAATSAGLGSPYGVAVDSTGNVYIADKNNNRIRKVAAGSGVVSTVAGNGTAAYGGDAGPATSASLNLPSGVAVDSGGNLYVADSSNHRIRKVAAGTGIITTVAGNGTAGYAGDGGLPTAASLFNPTGVAIDSFGRLYIADRSNQRVRRVSSIFSNYSTTITTVAGTGTASFSGDGGPATSATLSGPNGVGVDTAGNLYIADYTNNRIRMVSVSTGNISTVVGSSVSGYLGDGGSATAASLRYPTGVVVDSSGNLYIADYSTAHIRKVTAGTGIISTIAGNGIIGFAGDGGQGVVASLSSPSGVALDGAGDLYIADNGNNRIRKVILQGVAVPTTGSISGKVVNASGSGVSGATVDVYLKSPWTSIGRYTTDAGGNYTISGLKDGGYVFDIYATGYAEQWYGNAHSSDQATVVTVSGANTVTGLNTILPVAGSISGKVINSAGSGIAGITVMVHFSNLINAWGVTTDASGTYAVGGLPPDNYTVEFVDNSSVYVNQWYNSKAVVSVTAGASVTGINVTLATPVAQGGSVSGKVTDTYGMGIGGISVQVYDAVSNVSLTSVATAADGTYTVSGLTGNCKIRFMSGTTSYIAQWYNNNVGNSVSTADVIAVTVGTTTSGINAQLIAGGTISGTVIDRGTGIGIGGISVVAFNGATNRMVLSTTTSTTGSYSLTPLPVGSYIIRFNSTNSANNYVPLWNNYRPSNATADMLSVSAGSMLTVNASLATGGTISGLLTDGANGVSGITVNAYNAYDENIASAVTDATGMYTVKGLLDGNYKLRFQETANSSSYSAVGYVYQVYTNPNITTVYLSKGTLVPVTSATPATGINAVLVKGVGSISGTVTSTTGVLLSGATVRATDLSGGFFGSATSKSDGTYSIKGIPSGTYKVEFYRSDLSAQQWYAGAGDFTSATTVTVTAPSDTPAINGILGSGSGIQLPTVIKGFGSVDIGSFATKTFTVYNYGTSNLTIGSIGTTGSGFTLANDRCSGMTLPGLGYCTLQVTFRPTVAGDTNATVTIPSTDPDSSAVGIVVKGTGVAATGGPGTAVGTYTYDSVNLVFSMNWTSSTFLCNGPTLGLDTATITSLTTTSMTWHWNDGGSDMTWTRTGGSGIYGTWNYTDSSNGSVFALTIDQLGTMNATGVTYCSSSSPPGSPTNVTAVAGNGQATVSFTPPSSNGGSSITGYTVTASPGGMTANGTGSPLTVTGLTNDMYYTFTVTATNVAGTGAASAISASIMPLSGSEIAGVCGRSNGFSFLSAPAVDLCATGTPSAVSGSTLWNWTCAGSNGGSNATCSATPVSTSGPTLSVGAVSGTRGQTVTVPVTLTTNSSLLAAVSIDLGYDPAILSVAMNTATPPKPTAAVAGAAATAADKTVIQNIPTSGILRIGVINSANSNAIGNGVVTNVTFTINSSAVIGSKILLSNLPGATDPSGNNIPISGASSFITIIAKAGDCNGTNDVDIAEVQSAINMFLGTKAVLGCVDVDSNGTVSIAEVQKAINAFLGF